jgi:hypothetical protein
MGESRTATLGNLMVRAQYLLHFGLEQHTIQLKRIGKLADTPDTQSLFEQALRRFSPV